jgi:spermidine synthase
MLPWEIVARTRAPDGTELVLARRGEEWVVRAGGRVLMPSRTHGSEEALATLALERAPRARTVLIGGLGLGYTLRAALDRLPPDGRAIVVELLPEVEGWVRGPVAHLAGHPLDDPRAEIRHGDVAEHVGAAREAYDAILLDVDNGPGTMAPAANARLHGHRGIRCCREALRPGGVLAIWSAAPDRDHAARLEAAGFRDVEVRIVPARGASARGVRHAIFLATRGGPPTAMPRGRARATRSPERNPGKVAGSGHRRPPRRARDGRR